MVIKSYLSKPCHFFCQLNFITRYQIVLCGCSYACKNLLNFICLTEVHCKIQQLQSNSYVLRGLGPERDNHSQHSWIFGNAITYQLKFVKYSNFPLILRIQGKINTIISCLSYNFLLGKYLFFAGLKAISKF